jgi:membrane associated rhomboid family serine protease
MADLALRRRGVRGAARLGAALRALGGRVLCSVRATPVTWSLIASMVAVWALEGALLGQVHGGRAIGYLSFGALPNVTVRGSGGPGDWWRYVSSAFLHESPVHLLFNSVALLVVGVRVERLYGRAVMLATFALAAAAAGAVWIAASALGLEELGDFSAGASGGLCGLIGLLTMFGRLRRGSVDRRLATASVVPALAVTGLLVVTGEVLGGVNNIAHAGGLVCGLLLGTRIPPLPCYGGRRLRRGERALLMVLVGGLLLALGVAGQHLVQRVLEPAS